MKKIRKIRNYEDLHEGKHIGGERAADGWQDEPVPGKQVVHKLGYEKAYQNSSEQAKQDRMQVDKVIAEKYSPENLVRSGNNINAKTT